MLLPGKGKLEGRADCRALRVCSGDALGHGGALRLALVDLEHTFLKEGLVRLRPMGSVYPDARAGITRADQVSQPGPSRGLAAAASQVRISPCAQSVPLWFL